MNQGLWARPVLLPVSWWTLLALALFCAASFALYGSGLSAALVFDDLDFFDSPYIATYGAEIQPLLGRYWPYASFAHQSLLFGQGAEGMRAGNVLLHALTAFSLTLFVAKLMAATPTGPKYAGPFAGEFAALMAGFLFLMHPVGVYAVAYLVQRSTLMATLFSLLMWISYLAGLQSGRRSWMFMSVLFYYFAVFSKQHAVLAPLVPLALSVLFRKTTHPRAGWQVLVSVYATYCVVAGVAAISSVHILGTSYEPLLVFVDEGADWHERIFLLERVHWLSILTQGGLFFKYLALWIWPAQAAMSVDMRELFVNNLANPANWLGLIAFLAFGVAAIMLLMRGGQSGVLGLGMCMTWGLFGVELSTVRLQEVFVLYRSYLWMPGLAVATAAGLRALVGNLRLRWVVPLCLLWTAALFIAAGYRLATFGSENLLWDDAVRLIEKQPQPGAFAERAYHNRGTTFARSRDFDRALADFDMALSKNDRYYLPYYSRASAMAELGRLGEALTDYGLALDLNPTFSKARIGRALVLERLGRRADALADLHRACQEANAWACYLHHQRTDPTGDFSFKAAQ